MKETDRGTILETINKVRTNVIKLALKYVAIKNFFSMKKISVILMKYFLKSSQLSLPLYSKFSSQQNPVNISWFTTICLFLEVILIIKILGITKRNYFFIFSIYFR